MFVFYITSFVLWVFRSKHAVANQQKLGFYGDLPSKNLYHPPLPRSLKYPIFGTSIHEGIHHDFGEETWNLEQMDDSHE